MNEFIFCKSLLINYVIKRFSWQDRRPILVNYYAKCEYKQNNIFNINYFYFLFLLFGKKEFGPWFIKKLKMICPFGGKTWNTKIENPFHQLGNVLDSLKYFEHSICRILLLLWFFFLGSMILSTNKQNISSLFSFSFIIIYARI